MPANTKTTLQEAREQMSAALNLIDAALVEEAKAPAVRDFEHLHITVPEINDLDDAYDRYILIWMLEHNASITEMLAGVAQQLPLENNGTKTVEDIMREAQASFEVDEGFDGEIYVSFPEWLQSEKSAYIRKRLDIDLAAIKVPDAEDEVSDDANDASEANDIIAEPETLDEPDTDDISDEELLAQALNDEQERVDNIELSTPADDIAQETSDAAIKTDFEEMRYGVKPIQAHFPDVPPMDIHRETDAEIEEQVSDIIAMFSPGNMPKKTLADNSTAKRFGDAVRARTSKPEQKSDSSQVESSQDDKPGFSLPSQRRGAENVKLPRKDS